MNTTTFKSVASEGVMSSCPITVTLEHSRCLSPGVSLHVFSVPGRHVPQLNLTGHIDLLFFEDLDPTRKSKLHADRFFTFSPCYTRAGSDERPAEIHVLVRNGRVAQLLGIPRMNGPLTAGIVSTSGGFPPEALENLEQASCVASGTGLAPFIPLCESQHDTRVAQLLYTINGNDFRAIEYLLESGTLDPGKWAAVTVFVTAGDSIHGLIAGKPVWEWEQRLAKLQSRYSPNMRFKCRRIAKQDVVRNGSANTSKILFCGGKALEWQMRMWLLGELTVYTT